MDRLSVSYPKQMLDNLLIAMFSILPLVDSANGYLRGKLPLGILYKLCLCGVLSLSLLHKQKLRPRTLLILLGSVGYVVFSVGANALLERSMDFQTDYAIKLLFNIGTGYLLLENLYNGTISGKSLFRMLDFSSWLMCFSFLIPYFLGMGRSVYHGVGYKAFFISQNELSLILICLFYFCLYKLSLKFTVFTAGQVGMLMLCCLLLNTKSTILACLMGAGVYGLYLLAKTPLKYRLLVVAGLPLALVAFKDTIAKVVGNMTNRFTYMLGNQFGGSLMSTLLSGRDSFVSDAWAHLTEEFFLFRFFFGNGFYLEKLVEMDLVDIFFALGLVGSIAVVIVLLLLLIKCIKNCWKDTYPIRIMSFLLILFFLNITGHVLFMAMSGCYFVVYLCFLTHYKPETDRR